jgi:hypothetical protein
MQSSACPLGLKLLFGHLQFELAFVRPLREEWLPQVERICTEEVVIPLASGTAPVGLPAIESFTRSPTLG